MAIMGIIGLEAREDFSSVPGYATHEVLNQSGDLADYNAYADERVLVEAVEAFGAVWADDTLRWAGVCRQRKGAASRAPGEPLWAGAQDA
jgi:hypothetical protein